MCAYHVKYRQDEKIECDALVTRLNAYSNAEPSKIPLYPGVSRESSFKYVGETVTLWCLTDFLQNSKYSKETLELNRRDAKKRKRDASRGRKEGE